MHVNMDVSQYERVACLHVDIRHPLLIHFIYSAILVQMCVLWEKGRAIRGYRRLDSCHERQCTSCFFCDAGFGPIVQSHPNRFWIDEAYIYHLRISTGVF